MNFQTTLAKHYKAERAHCCAICIEARSLAAADCAGAADDDPSGIATYSQVGAQFGFGMLWTMLFTFPLMAAIQEICARLGRITGVGIAANLEEVLPKARRLWPYSDIECR